MSFVYAFILLLIVLYFLYLMCPYRDRNCFGLPKKKTTWEEAKELIPIPPTPVILKKTPKRLYIPKDKREEFHKLVQEEFTNRSVNSKWNLWIFIENIYPETGEGYWRITEDGTHVLHPYVEEKIYE